MFLILVVVVVSRFVQDKLREVVWRGPGRQVGRRAGVQVSGRGPGR